MLFTICTINKTYYQRDNCKQQSIGFQLVKWRNDNQIANRQLQQGFQYTYVCKSIHMLMGDYTLHQIQM